MEQTSSNQGLESGFNLEKAYSSAEQSLAKSRESKQGIEGVSAGKVTLTPEERKERSEQDSINRRIVREVSRAKATGRVSNWLQRYSAQKEAEFNSQNSTLQQTATPTASVTYSKAYEVSNAAPLATQKKSTSTSNNGGGATTRTFQVCINGEAKNINIYVAGDPY